MDLWSEIGSLWDLAGDGEPVPAAARATELAGSTTDVAERAILLAFRGLCELVACSYVESTRTALEAAELAERATGPLAPDARYYAGAVRLVAAAMREPDRADSELSLPLPRLADINAFAAAIQADRPERLLLAYPAFEASMSSGNFAGVAALITRFRPFADADFPRYPRQGAQAAGPGH